MKTKLPAILLLLPILLLAACKETAQPEPDALGLRWGMTVEEVAAKYPRSSEEVTKDGAGREIFKNGTTQLIGHEWNLRTHYNNGELDVIGLTITVADEKDANRLVYELTDLLEQKYGPTGQSAVNDGAWYLPRTKISINKLSPRYVWLSYSARPGYADLDKL